MALPCKKRDNMQALGSLGCLESLEEEDAQLSLNKRRRSSIIGVDSVSNNQQAALNSGCATLDIDASDYECSICLQILVDPVVGEPVTHYSLRGAGKHLPARMGQWAMPSSSDP